MKERIEHADSANEALHDSEERFRHLVENAFDIVLECAGSGRILYASPNIADVLGVEPSAIVGTFLMDRLHPDDVRMGVESFTNAVRHGQKIHQTLRYRHESGDWRIIEGRGQAYNTQAGKPRVVIIGRDVTNRTLAEDNLRRAQRRLELHLQQLPVAVIGWDLQGRVTEWNPAAERMFGYTKEEVFGQQASDLIQAPGEQEEATERNLTALDDFSGGSYRVTSENLTKSGRPILCQWSVVPLHDGSGTMTGVLTIAEDVSERDRARRLEEAAYKDPVTGMPNRRLFDDRLASCVESKRRRDDAFAVLYVDLDNFKSINDRYGHEVGDSVLSAIGLRLRVCVREGDVVARLGGDEFGIILTHVETRKYAQEIAERIVESLGHPLSAGDRAFNATASIGLSTFPEDGNDAATLLRKADAAMYRAKQKGKATYST